MSIFWSARNGVAVVVVVVVVVVIKIKKIIIIVVGVVVRKHHPTFFGNDISHQKYHPILKKTTHPKQRPVLFCFCGKTRCSTSFSSFKGFIFLVKVGLS